MTAISQVVSVTTSLSGRVVSQVGFGVPLIGGYHTKYLDRVRSYTSIRALEADGFDSDDAIHRAATRLLAQTPTVKTFKVGRFALAPTMVLTLTPTVEQQGLYVVEIDGVECQAIPVLTLTPTVVNEADYSVTIDGKEYETTSDGSATATEICDALRTLINADTATHGITGTGTATLILTRAANTVAVVTTSTNLVAGANTATEICDALRTSIQGSDAATAFVETGTATLILTASGSPGTTPDVQMSTNLTAQNTTTDAGIGTDLTAISAADDDWYGLVMVDYGKAQIAAAVTALSATKKQIFAVTCDHDVINTAYSLSATDIASSLKIASADRVHLFWSRQPGLYPNAGAAAGLCEQPGTSTYAFKPIVGVSPDVLSDTHNSRLLAKNANYLMAIGSTYVTSNNGINSSGLFTDLRILVDYLDARCAEAILGALMSAKKIPFIDEGIGVITGAMESFFLLEEERGSIVKGTTVVEAPLRSETLDADRLLRALKDVTYHVTASGAIHSVDVEGNVAQ
jgi:hypothetical protein